MRESSLQLKLILGARTNCFPSNLEKRWNDFIDLEDDYVDESNKFCERDIIFLVGIERSVSYCWLLYEYAELNWSSVLKEIKKLIKLP